MQEQELVLKKVVQRQKKELGEWRRWSMPEQTRQKVGLACLASSLAGAGIFFHCCLQALVQKAEATEASLLEQVEELKNQNTKQGFTIRSLKRQLAEVSKVAAEVKEQLSDERTHHERLVTQVSKQLLCEVVDKHHVHQRYFVIVVASEGPKVRLNAEQEAVIG